MRLGLGPQTLVEEPSLFQKAKLCTDSNIGESIASCFGSTRKTKPSTQSSGFFTFKKAWFACTSVGYLKQVGYADERCTAI